MSKSLNQYIWLANVRLWSYQSFPNISKHMSKNWNQWRLARKRNKLTSLQVYKRNKMLACVNCMIHKKTTFFTIITSFPLNFWTKACIQMNRELKNHYWQKTKLAFLEHKRLYIKKAVCFLSYSFQLTSITKQTLNPVCVCVCLESVMLYIYLLLYLVFTQNCVDLQPFLFLQNILS